jgi:hypothetical protein
VIDTLKVSDRFHITAQTDYFYLEAHVDILNRALINLDDYEEFEYKPSPVPCAATAMSFSGTPLARVIQELKRIHTRIGAFILAATRYLRTERSYVLAGGANSRDIQREVVKDHIMMLIMRLHFQETG